MTPKLADKLIASGAFVTVTHAVTRETFTAVFTGRDRKLIETADGKLFERLDLVVREIAEIEER